ncbi:hypothetical protein R3P38DRAFT_3168870 [Favolaschia claudopus]|uniref:Uncharacterized protein n=1 Tax=Favolaschia claudopus TaxID=2862362 RepID=A0AAW0DWX3_9AGAR
MSDWAEELEATAEEKQDAPVPRNIAQFFDLEALDASEDEEDEHSEVHEDFIDDTPRSLSRSRPMTQWDDLPGSEQEDLQKLADLIRVRYQKRVVLPQAEFNPSAIPFLDLYPTIDNHPIYAVRISTGSEYDFVSRMYDLGERLTIVSASYREDVPGTAYIEIVDPEKLSSLPSCWPRVGRPRLVPVTERCKLLTMTKLPVPLRPGWARLRRPHQLAGDVVFIVSVDAVVEAVAQKVNKHGIVDLVVGIFWAEQLFQPDRPPSAAETDFFAHRFPKTIAVADIYTQHVLAFGAGDAFVIPKQSWFMYGEDGRRKSSVFSYWGRILAIQEIGSSHFAACVRSIDYVNHTMKGTVQYIPLRFLRPSFFREDRQLRPMDRVLVCMGSEHRGSVGRVVGTSEDAIVTVALTYADSLTVEIPMKHLQICFMCGDNVEVTFGPRLGQVGILVAGRTGGFWIVYTGTNTSQPTITVQVHALRLIASQLREVPQLPKRVEATKAQVAEDSESPPAFDPDAVQNAAALANSDCANLDKVKKLLYTGDRFFGRQVRVVGGDTTFMGREYKGQTGQVVGTSLATRPSNRNTKEPLPLEYVALLHLTGHKDLWKCATVQVRLHVGARIIQVDIDHLQDTNTHLLLARSVHVPWEGPPRPITPSPPSVEGEGVWQATVPRLPSMHTTMLRMETEETNGGWLCKQQLKLKRIDVVVDTSFVPPHWAPRWTRDLIKAHGKTGYVVMDEKFNPRTHKAVVKLDPMGHNLFCPVENLRPQRTLYIPYIHDDRDSIAIGNVRVVIIGCDVDGRFAYVGSYARVEPNTARDDGTVRVRFPVNPWTPDVEAPTLRFPLASLCRSLNRQPLGHTTNPMTSQFFYMHPALNADVL